MRDRHAIRAAALALAGLVGLGSASGCQNVNREWWKKPAEPPSAATEPAGQARAAEDPATLKAENESLRSELEELRIRERRLSDQLKELQFLSVQQGKTIEALADAPAQRDRYKQQAEQLALEVDRLKDQLNLLKYGRAIPPPPTSGPAASQPAAPGPGELPSWPGPASRPADAPAGPSAAPPAREPGAGD